MCKIWIGCVLTKSNELFWSSMGLMDVFRCWRGKHVWREIILAENPYPFGVIPIPKLYEQCCVCGELRRIEE